MGSFFFLTPLFSVLCLGPGAVRMSWPPGRGLGCWCSLLLRGPGWSSCPRAGAKGVQLRDRALTTPLGVVVPGSRSIECIWECECGYRVLFCVSTCGARVCIFVCVHEGGNVCLCIWVLVRLRLCVRSGLRLHLTHHLSRPPPHHHALPVEDAAGAWWFLAPGQDARVSAGPLSAVAWRGLALLALLGPDWGVGGLWVSGPRARSALVWSTAGGACGLAATAPWGVYTVAVGGHTFGLSSALFWVEGAVVPAVVLLGVPCPGGPPDVWGPDLFHACFMPCGMGLLFPTHTIKHLHGGTL